MDNNPTLAALCYIQSDGNPKEFLNLEESQLYNVRSGGRDWLIDHMARGVVAFAESKGAGLVIEDLKFMNDRDVSTKFNRMVNMEYGKANDRKNLKGEGGSLVSWLGQRKEVLGN